MRVAAAIVVLGLLGPSSGGAAAPSFQDDDRLYIESVPEAFLRKLTAAEEARDWRKIVELHTLAHDSFSRKLGQPDPAVRRWLPLPQVLNRRLLAMPEAAREPYETVARDLLETTDDPEARRRIARKYAFTPAGRRALEALANRDYDEGRLREAVRDWSTLLDLHAAPELVARLALAHVASGDARSLDLLKAGAADGELRVGGRRTMLREFLKGLVATPSAEPLQRPAPPPRAAPELRLGAYDLKADGGPFGRHAATAIPAFGAHEGKDYLVITNGVRVTAVAPDRASGGTLSDAIEWQYPREGTVRWMPNSYYGPPFPAVGAALSGGRAFVTMFTASWQNRPQQVGRRPDRFEGPGALRAFDLARGELIWDTETLEVETGSEKQPLVESLPFGRRNYSFAGPPVVRGDRLYAAVMTSPMTERECWMLCLNAADGRPRWCTSIASTTPTRETIAIPSFTEQEGTIVYQTNFGVVAALDAERGTIEWLAKYPSSARRATVSAPAILGNVVYVMAQDAEVPLAYDRWTGVELPFPSLEVPWTALQQLVGTAGEWLVFSGRQSFAVRVRDAQAVELLEADASGSGRAAVSGGRVYLPVRSQLQVYDSASWKLLGSYRLPEGAEKGNLVVADGYIASQGERLELASGQAALFERFKDRVDGAAPRADACRQLGQILEAAARPAEALPYYRRALSRIENDPAWQETAESLRKKIDDLSEKPAPPKE